MPPLTISVFPAEETLAPDQSCIMFSPVSDIMRGKSRSTICSISMLLAPSSSWRSAGMVSANVECYLRQNHVYEADGTETPTPSYALLNLSAGTDIHIRRSKVAELYVTASNLLDCAYQNHLSRLKYADMNALTGRRGVYNMGRNVTFKLVVPIRF